MSLFRVRLLPAGHGDCILVEYGKPSAPRRVLIDGGTAGTGARLEKALEALGPGARKLDLVVVTHVDADHIAGMLAMVEGELALEFGDFWFNGYRHLSGLEEMGPVQGETLTTWLVDGDRGRRWNKAFGGKAVVVAAGDAPVTKKLEGGMSLTLLSPTRAKLEALKPVWEEECQKAGLDPEEKTREEPVEGLEPMGPIDVDGLAAAPFLEDASPANGSSIAFIAEYGGRSLLFGGDAHPGVLEAAIRRLPGGRIRVDAFKVPHHGSKHNLSPGLLDVVETKRFLFSTNGAYFKHPDREAISRVLVREIDGCELWFNAQSQYTEAWKDAALEEEWGYRAVLPKVKADGAVLEL
jgi:beta-lactamase superfamily II metal-dependent hydrolase